VSIREFYEAYWREPKAPPQGDPTAGERMACLRAALESFVSGPAEKVRILDAGCGDGEFVAFLRDLGFRVSGVDLSEGAIVRARQRCPDVQFRAASLEEVLPFGDESFDAIWCTEVLEHLFDIHGTLAEFNRILKPKGAVLLTTPYHGLVKNLLIALAGFDRHFNPDLSHIRFFSKTSLDRCLRRAGFVPIRWRGVGRVRPLWKSVFVVARKDGAPLLAPEILG